MGIFLFQIDLAARIIWPRGTLKTGRQTHFYMSGDIKYGATNNILEGKPKPYIFYPVDKNPKNKSTKITKLATTCLTYNLDNMAMLPIC